MLDAEDWVEILNNYRVVTKRMVANTLGIATMSWFWLAKVEIVMYWLAKWDPQTKVASVQRGSSSQIILLGVELPAHLAGMQEEPPLLGFGTTPQNLNNMARCIFAEFLYPGCTW